MPPRRTRSSATAATHSAGRASATNSWSNAALKLMLATRPSTAIASSCASLAAALLMPDAMPALRSPAAVMTAEVRGVTQVPKPAPIKRIGKRARQYWLMSVCEPDERRGGNQRTNRDRQAWPKLVTNLPDHGANTNIATIDGDQRQTCLRRRVWNACIRTIGRKNMTAPMAVKITMVMTFRPLKARDLKIASGSIGVEARRSQ